MGLSVTQLLCVLIGAVALLVVVLVVWSTAGGVWEKRTTRPREQLMASKTDEKLAPFVEWLTLRAQEQLGISVSQDEMAMNRIKSAAAEALRNLDRDAETEINLPFLTADSSGPKNFSLSVRREDVRKPGP